MGGWGLKHLQCALISSAHKCPGAGTHLAALPVDPRVGVVCLYGAIFRCVWILPLLAFVASAAGWHQPHTLVCPEQSNQVSGPDADDCRRPWIPGSFCLSHRQAGALGSMFAVFCFI